MESEDGGKGIQSTISNSRPNPSVITGVYALPPGIVISTCNFAWLSDTASGPPLPGCIPVFVGSDSEGHFGHGCPRCNGYWRSGPFAQFCPYCGLHAQAHQFVSAAQQKYVELYCAKWEEAALGDVGSEVTIDLDEVADATLKKVEKPDFYVSEQRQQTILKCGECDEFNDILGRFGYCSLCYTRNDFHVLSNELFPAVRKDLDANAAPERCLRDAVSYFDTFVKQYARAFSEQIPMTPKRRNFLQKSNFSSLHYMTEKFSAWFDIQLNKKISDAELEFANRMFLRRHVYEHNGGVIDQSYVSRSTDDTVRIGQRISETAGDVHSVITHFQTIAKALHTGFHTVLPPDQKAIENRRARRKA